MISMRILLAEDEEIVRKIFINLIHGLTSKVIECSTLQETMEAAKEDDFDIIVLDLTLLDSSLENTLAHVGDIKRMGKAPIVVITGALLPDIEERCRSAGCDYVITKDGLFRKARATIAALHAAVLKHPRQHPGDDYLSHVEMFEKMVHAG
jgi:CheY-like chemotaxis protein